MTSLEWVCLIVTGAGLMAGYLMGRADGRQLGETKEALRELSKPPRPFLKPDVVLGRAELVSKGVDRDVYPDW